LKSKWLRNRVDNRLDSLVRMWVDTIVPFYNRKYKVDNVLSAR
jgi:hypothetical protein